LPLIRGHLQERAPTVAAVKGSSQHRRLLQYLEQDTPVYAQHGGLRLGGDGGVAGRVVQQPALTEALARPEVRTYIPFSMDNDAPIHDRIEGVCWSALHDHVDAGWKRTHL
jgi:hypothetical protein